MQAALLEGRKALPLCLPNPPVGCVLVKDGEIIARGHTQPLGMNHAEAMALAQISGDLAPIVAYVTHRSHAHSKVEPHRVPKLLLPAVSNE
jgi:pyrimidine deaminase RibD-like protein